MALTPADRLLLQRCLQRQPGAWNDFVDRYLGLVYHVIHYTAHMRSMPLRAEDIEDLAGEVLLQLVANDYAVLRQFKGQSSLATYLTVICRRICVHQLTRKAARQDEQHELNGKKQTEHEMLLSKSSPQLSLEIMEEVQSLLNKLPTREREVVRLFYLEGRSYEEISTALHIPVNTIGPILSRAKKSLRSSKNGIPEPSKKPSKH